MIYECEVFLLSNWIDCIVEAELLLLLFPSVSSLTNCLNQLGHFAMTMTAQFPVKLAKKPFVEQPLDQESLEKRSRVTCQ